MEVDKLYRQIQKEIGKLLVEFGFKKVKSYYRREYPDSDCVFSFDKPRGESDENTLLWFLLGGITYKVLNPIFRPGRDPNTFTTADADTFLYDGEPPQALAGREQLFWKITPTTDVAEHVAEFREAVAPKLDQLQLLSSLDWYIDNLLTHIANSGSEGLGINGVVKATVAAKLAGRDGDYQTLREVVNRHPQGDGWFARYHLNLAVDKGATS